jgi:AsmA protein
MKRLLIVLVVLVLVIIAAGASALLLVDANHFRPQIQASLSQAMGRQVTLGKLHVSILSGSLDADDIRIGDDPAFGKQPFVSAKSLEVGVRLWPLIVHQQLHVTSLTLDQPQVRLVQNRAGHWNFASFAASDKTAAPAAESSSAVPAFSVDKLRINDGSIELKRAVGGTRNYDKVQISADRISTQSAFPFSMSAAIAGGGTLKLDGKLGPWNAGNAVLTPVNAHLVMRGLDLVGAGLMSKGDGVGGVLDLDTQITSKTGTLHSKGKITAHKLQLVASGSPAPQPVRIDYQADYKLSSGTGSITHTTLGTGKARLAVGGSFDNRGAVMRLNLAIKGQQLPVDDLQPLLPAFGVVLPKNSRLSGGTLGVNLRARGPLDKLVIRGPITLDNSRLAGYSLGSKLGGALSLAGIKAPRDTVIKHAGATLNITPAGIHADPAEAQITGLGEVNGKGGMATSGALDFDMLVKLDKAIAGSGGNSGLLSHSKAGRMLGGVLGGSSSQGIGVHVGGTASEPKFKLDKSAVVGLLKSGLDKAAHKNAGSSEPATSSKQSNSTKEVLGNLLRGALEKKNKDKDTSGGK